MSAHYQRTKQELEELEDYDLFERKGNVLHHISDHELRALIDKQESFTKTRVTNFKQTIKN